VFGLLLLVPRFSRLAAWGIIALLIAVFPANVYLYQHQDILPGPPLLHVLRLPLQAVFILWAFWHTKERWSLCSDELKNKRCVSDPLDSSS
jgi:uncharacterized membrane protein